MTRPEPLAARDPVCGMTVVPERAAARRQHGGRDVYFCAEGCARAFDADPGRYTAPSGAAEPRPPAVRALPTAPARSDESSLGLSIQGMHCASCVTTIEKALSSVPGVAEASVNLGT